MRKSIKQYIKWLAPLSAAVLVAACSGGGSVTNAGGGSNNNTGSLDNLSMVAPSAYPAGMAASVPVVVTNNGSESINNLSYSIDSASNTTDGTITIQAASASSCRVIAAKASCTLMAEIAATPASHPGSFSVTTSQGAAKSGVRTSLSSTTLAVNVNVGLVQMPTNTSSGADGLTLYYPSAVVGNESGATQLIITAVVTSANAGSFNTINLVDANGNPLSYTILSGNSGTGMSNLPYGSIVSFLVTVPNGGSQVQFAAQTQQNAEVVSTASNSNTVGVTNPAVPTGIMQVSPNYFDLTPTNESQTITLNNNGNGPISNLSFSLTSPLTELSNSCGSTLAAGSSCQYVVKFNKDIPKAGTSGVTISYNDGTAIQSSTATVNYTGVDPIAGLTITSNNPNFDFTTRTKTPTQTSLVTLTNSGNSSESGFSFNSVSHFSTNTTDVTNPCLASTVLEVGSSCNINLVYTNSTLTSPTTADVQVNYNYGQDSRSTYSTIKVTYQTLQSMAILGLAPKPVTFANILNNGVDSNLQQLTLTNTGDDTPSGISSTLTGSDAVLFNTNVCAAVFAAGGSSCNITFGAANSGVAAGSKTATFTVNYTPYTGASTTSNTSTTLNGQVVTAQSANIVLSNPTPSGFANDGAAAGATYQVQQNAASPTLSYTITNSGPVAATDFYISGGVGIVWSYSGCGDVNNKITLDSGGTCTLTFTLSTTVTGSRNLALAGLTMHWVDEDSPTGQTQLMSGTVNANVYVPASIAITTNPASNISVAPGGSFTLSAQLTGGYDVQAQTITAATTASGVSFSNNSCALNSQNSYGCTITANVDSSATPSSGNTVTLSNTTTPSMAPTPSSVSFAIAQSGGTIALPQTGQTPTLPVNPALVGMDGYTFIGVPWAYVTSGATTPATRFTVNPNDANCIIDNLTGLEWIKTPSSTPYAWRAGNVGSYTYPAQAAVDAYNANVTCGHNDWYLPTINDLSSLLNDGFIGGVNNYQSEWLNSQGFSNVQAGYYWSSSTTASRTDYAWVVNFNFGNVFAYFKNRGNYVWPVRLAQ